MILITNNHIITCLKIRNRYDKWQKYIPSDCSILFSTFNVTFCDDLIDNINILDYTEDNIILLDALFVILSKMRNIRLTPALIRVSVVG